MDILTQKLDNLIKIAPNYKLDSFIVLKDRDGWTDGVLADLTNINFETVKAQATIKHAKLKPGAYMRYVIDKEQAPEVKRILDQITDEKVVTDIEFDLLTNTVNLLADGLKVKVNPSYIKYFATAYKQLWGSVQFKVSGELVPISVYIGDALTGFIMPIRQSWPMTKSMDLSLFL